MYACPRARCSGSLLDYGDQVQCALCGRTATGPRPPTAEEAAREKVRDLDRLYKYKMKRRQEAAALKASRTA